MKRPPPPPLFDVRNGSAGGEPGGGPGGDPPEDPNVGRLLAALDGRQVSSKEADRFSMDYFPTAPEYRALLVTFFISVGAASCSGEKIYLYFQ